MKYKLLIVLLVAFSTLTYSQEISKKLQRESRANVREGNKLYNQFKFSEAEKDYKKALKLNPTYPKAAYNLGNALYQQNKAKDAVSLYELANKNTKDDFSKAEGFHNIGNSFMKQKQYQQAVDAYKKSLLNNSKDDETRYNLALAQELLKQQQNKNNKNNKNNKDNKNKDKNKDNKDKNKDKNKDQNKNKNKQNPNNKDKKDQDKQDKNQQQQQRPNQLSQDQIKQLLDALNNEENKTINKLNAEKAKGQKIKQEKDW